MTVSIKFFGSALLLFLSVVSHGRSKAKTTSLAIAPSFYYLGTDGETSSLSMECKGAAPFNELHCSFNQMRIGKDSPDQVRESQLAIEKMSENDLTGEFDEVCNQTREATKKIPLILSDEKKAFAEESVKEWGNVCDCRSAEKKKPCILKAMTPIIEHAKDRCLVSYNSFDLTFKRAGARKWISNPGPVGLCNMLTVATIEHEPNSDSLWTFTQTRVTADTESKLCKDLIFNKPFTYSWKASTEALLNCRTVKFGR